ncbi:MAG: endonuclease/exonuclease/phosphatase family protein [Alphaproteobacteria bacterium]
MLRLATFNIENLDDDPDAVPPLAERLPVLRRILARLDADILCLQEVNAGDALDGLVHGTPWADFHRAVTTNAAGTRPRDVHNLVVLSRYPFREVRQVMHGFVPPLAWHWLAGGEETEMTFERPLLHVRIDVGGDRPLDVVDLHLRAPRPVVVPGGKATRAQWATVAAWAEGTFLAAMKRSGQALEARLLAEALLDDDDEAHIAIVGDFNADGREVPIALLRADVEATGNGELDGRSLVPLDGFVADSDRFTVRHGGRPVMLDHILLSRPLARLCRGVEILNRDLADELSAERAGLADPAGYHAPIVARLVLP